MVSVITLPIQFLQTQEKDIKTALDVTVEGTC